MGKSDSEVIALFNEQVNMTAEELEAWLDDPQSRKAGTGVGIESGHRIVEILRKNPGKMPDGYDEEDITHMRKVVSYNSRHLAQEDHLKETKTIEELEKAKSTISLKNWGHDPVKVKLERDAKSASDDNRGADDQCAQDGPEASEEDADGLGEIDTSLRVGGMETESVEDDALEVTYYET
ncbi:hypothetical protein BGW80DRAFT_1309162 [Lactifluus volemus]|nr:hypothetical protein BGW80DRAFT_1309162 [Lactifluus volemus]